MSQLNHSNSDETLQLNNSRTSCPQFGENSMAIKIGIITLYIAMGIIAIVGNSLLIRVIHTNPRMRTSFNYYIANMALSDILVQFFAIPRIVADAVLVARQWLITGPIGLILCKVVYFIPDVCTAVSIECIVLIAVDRFLAVISPTKVRYSSGKIRSTVIILTWAVAVAVAAPYFHFNKLRERNGIVFCTIDWGPELDTNLAHSTYMIFLVIVLIVAPFAIISILYSIIFLIVKHRRIPGNDTCDKRQLKQHEKAKINVLQLALAVVAAFLLSWIPYVIFLLLLITTWGWQVPCGLYVYRFVALLMAYSNTATNPWIYFILSGNYRQGLRKIFPCLVDDHKRKRLSWRATRTWVTNQTDSGAEAEIGHGVVQERKRTTTL